MCIIEYTLYSKKLKGGFKMIALISKSTGKYFKLCDDGKTLTNVKTIKTATVFSESNLDTLKKWIEPMKDKIELVYLQSTQVQELMLNMCGKMQYNRLP